MMVVVVVAAAMVIFWSFGVSKIYIYIYIHILCYGEHIRILSVVNRLSVNNSLTF
jgi:hypothetical protein